MCCISRAAFLLAKIECHEWGPIRTLAYSESFRYRANWFNSGFVDFFPWILDSNYDLDFRL